MESPIVPDDARWNLAEKIAFRFFFIFFLLFIIIQNNGAFPLWGYLMKYPTEWLHRFIPWVGKHVLHLSYDITVFTNGSGDTTYDYVIVFAIFVVALSGTVLWSVLDRGRANYQTLYYWLTVAIRFFVGLMLINYGLVKVIKLQFPDPGFARLTQTFGEASPMGLAWTFLGFSKGYNLFIGLAEVAAGLLLFRRTMTFGAIITLMAAANVMAVNYFYDVPVKILSTALVVMTLFLLMRDAARLIRFFFTGEAVRLPVIPAPVFQKKWLRVGKLVLKSLVIAYSVGFGTYQVLQYQKQMGTEAPKPKLYGLYEAQTVVVNGDTLPPLKTDSTYWQVLMIEREGFAALRYLSDKIDRFTTEIDTVAKKIDFTRRGVKPAQFSLNYDAPETDLLQLNGAIENDTISIVMKRKPETGFPLTSRGFHWINEYPFNR